MVAGRDDQLERLPDDLFLAIAEKASRRPIERFDQALLIGRDDRVRHVLEHRPARTSLSRNAWLSPVIDAATA